MKVVFHPASPSEASIIHDLAHEIWPRVYDYMISDLQIKYMLDQMYNTEQILQQMSEPGYQFVLVECDRTYMGFMAFQVFSDDMGAPETKLHKLYLHPSLHGMGIGSKMLLYAEEQAKQHFADTLFLNVNKHNKSIDFYKSQGYTIAKSEIIDIGNGFVMDDYVMLKTLK